MSVSAQGFHDYLVANPDVNFYTAKADLEAYYSTRDKGRGSGYKQFMRWVETYEDLVYPTGEMRNFNAMISDEVKRYRRSQPVQELRATHGLWTFEGPDDYVESTGWNGGNGRVNRIGFHPQLSNTFFACAAAGGLWKTSNSGNSWQCLTDGLPVIGCSGLAVDHDDDQTMYLFTGDGDGADVYSIGVLKTTDGGTTWKETDLSWDISTKARAYKLLMHPANADTLFAATSIGIYRTYNGGQSWTPILTGLTTDIEFQPGNPSTIYAARWGKIFKSDNFGTSWTELTGDPLPSAYLRIELAVTPADSNVLYALYGGHINGTGNGQFAGLYRSDDAGATFTQQTTSPNIIGYSPTGADSIHQGGYDLALAADPTDEDMVFVGGINVWRSENGGVDFEIVAYWNNTENTIGYVHADVHEIVYNGATVYVASDGGIFKSDDDGDTWTNLSSGLGLLQIYDFDVESGIVSCGTQDNGSNQWNLGSLTAVHSLGADGFKSLIDYSNTDIRYQSSQSSLKRSENGGDSYNININIPGQTGGTPYWTVDLIMHPTDPDTLFAGTKIEVYRTYDRGDSWTNMAAGLGGEIRALNQGASDGHRLYAASYSQIRRTDSAHASTPTWTDITSGLPVSQAAITDIAVDTDSSEVLWVSFSGFAGAHKVYYSPDTGLTWVNITGSLPNVPVKCLQIEGSSSNGIYAGTSIGIFYRNDVIGDWIFFSNGHPTVCVADLDIDDGELYSATFARGVWSAALYSSCPTIHFLTTGNDPSNPNSTGMQTYSSSVRTTSSRIITGGIGTDVRYHSEGEIILADGFHAREHNLFEASIRNCPD